MLVKVVFAWIWILEQVQLARLMYVACVIYPVIGLQDLLKLWQVPMLHVKGASMDAWQSSVLDFFVL